MSFSSKITTNAVSGFSMELSSQIIPKKLTFNISLKGKIEEIAMHHL